ncbi:MAG: hypothetical protein KatS3mg087_2004 [Patescibacteria group bacterium]|nr:MAG: hypothetical protein KatS3mg087_2004 [Patescibacteria group bacterium]
MGVIKEKMHLANKHTTQSPTPALSVTLPLSNLSPFTGTQTIYSYGKKHYETTDWLGNVRVTYTDKKSWQQNKFALNVSSSQDYYPFGAVMEGRDLEITNYRFGFQGQEGDDEVFGTNNLWVYKYRLHDARLGRFFSVDPLADKYPYNSVYAFSENILINAVELEGLEAYFIHGTWSNPNTWSQQTINAVTNVTNNTTFYLMVWSGYNVDKARKEAAEKLAKQIYETYTGKEPITLIGHSHGGNVAIMASNILKEKYNIQVDILITIATPVCEDYQVKEGSVKLHINIYNPADLVQIEGGNSNIIKSYETVGAEWQRDPYDPKGMILTPTPHMERIDRTGEKFLTGEMGSSGRTFENAINISVEPLKAIWKVKDPTGHSFHNAVNLWLENLKSIISNQPREEKVSPGQYISPY